MLHHSRHPRTTETPVVDWLSNNWSKPSSRRTEQPIHQGFRSMKGKPLLIRSHSNAPCLMLGINTHLRQRSQITTQAWTPRRLAGPVSLRCPERARQGSCSNLDSNLPVIIVNRRSTKRLEPGRTLWRRFSRENTTTLPASDLSPLRPASNSMSTFLWAPGQITSWSQIASCPLKSTAFGGTGPVRPMLEASEVFTKAAT